MNGLWNEIDIAAAEDPLAVFRRLRADGFNVFLHTQAGSGWSYLVRTGEVIAGLPPRPDRSSHDGATRIRPRGIGDEGSGDPRFRSGWIVLAAYDHGLGFERIPLPEREMIAWPPLLSLRAEEIVAVPPARSRIFPGDPASGEPAFSRPARPASPNLSGRFASGFDFTLGPWLTHTSDADYVAMVKRAKEYIAAGDIYQVNLARWFEADFAGDPLALFAALAGRNPSPYACFIDLPFLPTPTTIVSSSPELLFSLEGRRIVTRPIAGTYPRELDPAALPRDPKERAEHIMLVDLERNDLGRVAAPGSVAVEELLGLETYSHLHHIVSQVAAEARDGVGFDEILRAVFPGGTITGAPKIRAMEIISELEAARRGLYTGAIGFVDDSGDAVMNIAIRTAIVQAGKIRLAAGAGIVADSIPAREAAETRIKAGAFLEAAPDRRSPADAR